MTKKCILDIETTSLKPTDGRIICIGVKGVGDGTVVFYDKNEKRMIQNFLDYFKKQAFDEVVGFNVMFDIRFIFAKCLKYGIPAKRFFSSTFTDLMMVLKSVRRIYNFNKPGALDDWIKFLFGESKSMDNGLVPELYRQGRIADIIEYNKKDVELTHKLWERIMLVLNNEKPKAESAISRPSAGDGLDETKSN